MAFLDETGLAELWKLIKAEDDELATDIANGVKIATGTYTGTGKYGSSDLTTISLPFEPKAIIVNTSGIVPLCVPQLTTSYVSYSTYILNGVDFTNGSANVRKNGKQVQIYSNSGATPAATWYPQFQLNTSGKTYYYLAIG
jgi:hypothetical protein